MSCLGDKLERILREYSLKPFLCTSAPGRADFLNTHQDYKGLPVVPVAISLRTYMFALKRTRGYFRIESLNLKDEGRKYIDKFSVKSPKIKAGKWFGNYFRAVVRAVEERLKIGLSHGLRVVVVSDVPVASGLASSAALEVAFTYLLNREYGLDLSKKDVAEISYIAEHDVLNIPCGRLDQYGSTFGGIIKLNTKPPYDVYEIPFKDINLVILDSGVRHSTAEIHPVRQREIDEGLKRLMESDKVPRKLKEKLGYRYYEPKWEDISLDEIEPYLSLMSENSAKRIVFTIKMNELTEVALSVLGGEPLIKYRETLERYGIDVSKAHEIHEFLGEIMNKQHELLRDLYEVSLPELENIRNAALKAGALGVKISGAGLGGALIALFKDPEEGEEISRAALKAGARKSFIVKVDEGVRAEKII